MYIYYKMFNTIGLANIYLSSHIETLKREKRKKAFYCDENSVFALLTFLYIIQLR